MRLRAGNSRSLVATVLRLTAAMRTSNDIALQSTLRNNAIYNFTQDCRMRLRRMHAAVCDQGQRRQVTLRAQGLRCLSRRFHQSPSVPLREGVLEHSPWSQ